MSVRRSVGSFFRKSFNFFKWLFKGKSLTSHVAFLIIAYLGLKFVLFPLFFNLFGLVDVVAVISNSMHHQSGVINNTFTGWLVFNGFNQTDFVEWPFQYGLDMGDASFRVPLIGWPRTLLYYLIGF